MIKIISRRVAIVICLLFVLPVVVFPVKADNSFADLYVFGDSLSDTGNLASVIGDFPLPYFDNRVSNGPVAVEVLGGLLGLPANASLHLIGQDAGTNYAVVSARAGGTEPIDLSTQVNAFLAVHGFSAPSDALYIMFIGSNDVRDARDVVDKQLAHTLLNNAVDNIRVNLDKLILSGARSIVVVNVADIGNIPETIMLAEQSLDPGLIKRTTKKTRIFNRYLKKTLHDIEETHDMEIEIFNLFKYTKKVIEHAEAYGFDFTRVPCFYRSTGLFHPACNYGQDVNRFLFFDEEHPTAKGHTLIGTEMLKSVEELDD
ncbi:MAG: SGNH/GDSL hydrolase family protein [Thiohalomonadales bacterium]